MDTQCGGGLCSFVELIKRVTIQIVNFVTDIKDILDFSGYIVIMEFPCTSIGTGDSHYHQKHKNKVFFKHILKF